MRGRIALCQAALLLLGAPCLGAELFYMDHDPYTDRYVGPVGPLVISGEIIPGDHDRLLSKILENPDRFLAENKIILASDGGDVAEALKIAELVKSLYTQVSVGPLTGRCASACFFIYAAANHRETDGERLIGINRPYLVDAVPPGTADVGAAGSAGSAAGAENKALGKVSAFLRENAVPAYLVEEMFRRPSDEVYWLSGDDQRNLGYRSVSFRQFLRAQCAWDEGLEQSVLAGKLPAEELKDKWKCRSRATQLQARRALLLASKEMASGRGPAP